ELIEKCWDADPSKRPSIEDLCKILNAWKEFHTHSELAKQIDESEIAKKNRNNERNPEENQIIRE
ncbi:7348_t:CDS:1, partial [Acaulospora morrowiae]